MEGFKVGIVLGLFFGVPLWIRYSDPQLGIFVGFIVFALAAAAVEGSEKSEKDREELEKLRRVVAENDDSWAYLEDDEFEDIDPDDEEEDAR